MNHILQCKPKSPDEARTIIADARGEIGNFVRKILGRNPSLSHEDVEDLISSCWIEIYCSIPDWYDPSQTQLETPIYKRVYWAVSKCLNKYKKSQENLSKLIESTRPEDMFYNDTSFGDNFLQTSLEQQCKQNGTPLQQILYYRVKEDKTWSEVSAITGIKSQTAIRMAQEWYDNIVTKV